MNEYSEENIQELEIPKKTFFDKLKEYFFMFSLSDQTKDDIAQQVIQDSNFSKLYWVQLILSCVIATLGLLTNSIPVVI